MTNEDLLYNYFSNTLTQAQTLELNKRLENDPEFKAEFEFENNLKRAINDNANSNLKVKLKEFEANINANKIPKKTSSFNWRIAVSIVFLLGASWFGYNTFFGVDYNKLYATNFKEYPNTEFAITRGDSIDSPERKAFVAYEAGDYENAINNFKAIALKNKKGYHEFYKAQAYLKLGNLQKAKVLLKSIVAKKGQFAGESQWYLALIAIKAKDKVEATKQLSALIEDYDYNKYKAENLLKALN